MATTAQKIPDELIERARSVDMRELAARYTILRNVSGPKEQAGPCPKCGGKDRFHVTANWFLCHGGGDVCHPEPGDVIEFLRWLSPGLSFPEAVQQLAGGALPAAATTRRPAAAARRPAARQQTESEKAKLAEWLKKVDRLSREAQERLWGPAGEPGRAYLEQRALEPATWLAYGLGFDPNVPLANTDKKQQAPAIVMPWRSPVSGVFAIRYRYLQLQVYTDKNGDKQENKLYSQPRAHDNHQPLAGKLFGGQTLPADSFEPLAEGERPGESLRSLLLIEGELNAMSCWQVAGETRLDVLSVGSESSNLSPAAVAYAQRYRRVLVWADKGEVAQRLMVALPGAYGVRSPSGQDANDLLKAGLLGGFLATVRADAARDARELEGLLWDLWDASLLVAGIDSSTAAVVGELARRLGKAARLVQPEPGRWVAAHIYEGGEIWA